MPIKAVGSPLRILGIVVAWFATSAVSRTKQRRNRTGGSTRARPAVPSGSSGRSQRLELAQEVTPLGSN